MGQTLTEIAQSIQEAAERERNPKRVQLLYAFNGTGKTRLSRTFKQLIDPKEETVTEEASTGLRVLYYNAYTEDLFSWDNDLEGDAERKLNIRASNFTALALEFLRDQGQDQNIVGHFQRYAGDRITPLFSPDFSNVTFSIARGDDENVGNIKVSKGEESNLIWCVFYSLLELIIEQRNIPEPTERATDKFDDLRYVFIDDPVSSLDDAHLIELAVDIAGLIKASESDLNFVITTHNPLFFNVLFNEFNSSDSASGYRRKHSERMRLEKLDDGTLLLVPQADDSPFSYHLHLLGELERAVANGDIQKYHFNFLRNILEKTATFLGYKKWQDLLPQDNSGAREAYYNRIINLSSHGKFSGSEVAAVTENDKRVLRYLVEQLKNVNRFRPVAG